MGIVVVHGPDTGNLAAGWKDGRERLEEQKKAEAEAAAKKEKADQIAEAMNASFESNRDALMSRYERADERDANLSSTFPNSMRTGARSSAKEFAAWSDYVALQRSKLTSPEAIAIFDAGLEPAYAAKKRELDESALRYAVGNYAQMGIIDEAKLQEIDAILRDPNTDPSEVHAMLNKSAGEFAARQHRDGVIAKNMAHAESVLTSTRDSMKALRAAGRTLPDWMMDNVNDAEQAVMHAKIRAAGDPDADMGQMIHDALAILDRPSPQAQALSKYAQSQITALRKERAAIDPGDLQMIDGEYGPGKARADYLDAEIAKLEGMIGKGESGMVLPEETPWAPPMAPGARSFSLDGERVLVDSSRPGAVGEGAPSTPVAANANGAPGTKPLSSQLRLANDAMRGEIDPDGNFADTIDKGTGRLLASFAQLGIDVSPEAMSDMGRFSNSVLSRVDEIRAAEERGEVPKGQSKRVFENLLELIDTMVKASDENQSKLDEHEKETRGDAATRKSLREKEKKASGTRSTKPGGRGQTEN